jgi:nitrogen fixation protein NifB
MPLVSAPEHGTQFGLTGQREPTPRELQTIQDRCEAEGAGSGMTTMRHCRQCRADAIGLLSDDQGQELGGPADYLTSESAPDALAPDNGRPPTHDPELRRTVHQRIERRRGAAHRDLERSGVRSDLADRPAQTLLLAVATAGDGLVNQHFGRTEEFAVYEGGPGFARYVGTRSVSRYCGGPDTCGHERSKLERIAEMLADCSAVICSQAGAEPRRVLAEGGLAIIEVFGVIERAVAEAAERLLATPDEQEGTAS